MLLGADKGEGLLLVRGNRIPLQVVPSKAEYRLATTNPRDLEELAAAAWHERAAPRPSSNGADHRRVGEVLSARRTAANGTSHAAHD